MADLIAELEGVVRLSERATPGPFVVDDYADVTANSEDVARIVTGEDDAQLIVSAVNFLRTNAADIAAAVRDKRRLDWLERDCTDIPDELGMARQLYFGTYSSGQTLREAVDTAMRAGEGEG